MQTNAAELHKKNMQRPRLATLDELLKSVVPNFLSPVPPKRTFKGWLDNARIPRFKSNCAASRGGGTCWYSIAATEQFFKNRTTPPR